MIKLSTIIWGGENMKLKKLTPEEIREINENEENTKKNLITPVLQEKWGDSKSNIIMEYPINKGKIDVNLDFAHGDNYRADYLLIYRERTLALIEAKAQKLPASDGYEQAIDYAKLLQVPFTYATNGIDVIEKDMITQKNNNFVMENFPTPEELWNRYIEESKISKEEEVIITQPYYKFSADKKPRYYQRIAIDKTISAIINGHSRVLLVMATGTGKTFTAFQIIYRFWRMGLKKKILFLADRNILVDQTMKNDFSPFKEVMTKITDHNNIPTEYEVYLSLYHQLKNGDKNYYNQLPKDFFDLIVVDECHRGSADDNSNWREILEYFSSAVQIGLTATPKETEYVSNAKYFCSDNNGEPIYTYSLKQGIEDGFLAPYEVISVELNVDKEGFMPPEGMLDKYGNPVEKRRYLQEEFDRKIVIEERRKIVAKRITEYLKESGNRFAKTIVFCEGRDHAAEMVQLLENENEDLVRQDSRYVMRIMSGNDQGMKQLDNFLAPSSRYPVIAVTSKLLSTGVDTQTVENIVLDKTISSLSDFKQIIGRGTRLKEKYEINGNKYSKTHFTIIDFRNNYPKFDDPDFDGEPIGKSSIGENEKITSPKKNGERSGNNSKKKITRINGVEVEIIGNKVQYRSESGECVQSSINSCVKNNILAHYQHIEEFIMVWEKSEDRQLLLNELLLIDDFEQNITEQYKRSIDKFDIVLNVAYDVAPVQKDERIKKQEVVDFIATLSCKEQDIVMLLLEYYKTSHFSDLKKISIFALPLFASKGWSIKTAIKCFGNTQNYLNVINELENKIFTR